jgi:hypothetical protein
VFLAYLDESGDPAVYYITALMVEEQVAMPLSSTLDDVVDYVWTTYRGVRSTAELHGYDLAWGARDWQSGGILLRPRTPSSGRSMPSPNTT